MQFIFESKILTNERSILICAMEVYNFVQQNRREPMQKFEETVQPGNTSDSNSCPDFGSSSYADFQDTIPKYKLRPDKLLRIGFISMLRIPISTWSM